MRRVIVTVCSALLLLVGCVEDDGEGDASANLACRHFRNVAADYSAGILTVDELRGKLAEVHDDARYSETGAVAQAATDMLAAITAGDVEALTAAVTRMGSECAAAGF